MANSSGLLGLLEKNARQSFRVLALDPVVRSHERHSPELDSLARAGADGLKVSGLSYLSYVEKTPRDYELKVSGKAIRNSQKDQKTAKNRKGLRFPLQAAPHPPLSRKWSYRGHAFIDV